MQTYLPYQGFYQSLKVLKRSWLKTQLLDAKISLYVNMKKRDIDLGNRLNFSPKQCASFWREFKNHPSVFMWHGAESCLLDYAIVAYEQFLSRFLNVKIPKEMLQEISQQPLFLNCSVYPYWLGNENFHQSHQSTLMRRDEQRYELIFNQNGNLPNNLIPIWPKSAFDNLASLSEDHFRQEDLRELRRWLKRHKKWKIPF